MSRRNASRADKAKSSLAELLAVKETGKKRQELFELKEEANVYDVVEEKDYAKLVAKRREEGGDFVVDDEGLGYADIGEEEDWGVDASEEEKRKEEEKKKRKAESQKLSTKASKRREVVPGAARRMQGMFAAASASAAARPAMADPDDESMLEDILAGIEEDDHRDDRHLAASAPAPAPAPAPARAAPARAAMPAPAPRAPAPAPAPVPEPVEEAMEEPEEDGCGKPVAALDDEDMPVDDASAPPAAASPAPAAASPAPPAHPPLASSSSAAEPAAEESAPTVPATAEPAQAMDVESKPVSGWEATCQAAEDSPAPGPEDGGTEAGKEGGAGSKLDVDESGAMLFYHLDAFEDINMPGKVFLFGKVPVGEGRGQRYESACVIVDGLQRGLYAVPKEGLFADEDGTLAALEAAAAAGEEGSKVALMKELQRRAGPMKEELRTVLMDRGVTSFSMVPVKRNYAFELDSVKHEQQYVLKVRHPASCKALPSDLRGSTFSHVFGTHTSAMEAMLLKRRVMGPSWLAITGARPTSAAPLSWCKHEFILPSSKGIAHPKGAVRDSPPVVVAAVNLKTVMNHKQHVNEVVAASVLYCASVNIDGPMSRAEWNTPDALRHFSVVRKLDGGTFPLGWEDAVKAENAKPIAKKNNGLILSPQSSERALLSFLLARLQQIDADVLVGHNVLGFDLDVLLHRMQANKIPHWSRIGRLRRNKFPNLSVGGGDTFGGGASPGLQQALAGRLVCDTYLAAREFVREVSYSLTALTASQLRTERTELQSADIPGMYGSCASLLQLVKHAEGDAWLSLGLMFHLSVLPLTRQLTCLTGSLWSWALQSRRAQRIEYLLLHEFHARKYLLPDKLSYREKERLKGAASLQEDEDMEPGEGGMEGKSGPSKKSGKGPQYSGGLVLEPKKGLYDKIVLMLDFNSLYPSIIQEYNICFTTVQRSQADADAMPQLPDSSLDKAVLPQVLEKLVQRRRQVKEMLKSERDLVKKQQLDIRQQALKLTANSMYGCLGFVHSRFYAKPLAQLVTSQGRDILQATADMVQSNLGLDVIYGDTDSIMINSNTSDVAEARRMGAAVKKEVNKKYRLLEIELDGIYKTMLLLKKKKYAALKLEQRGPDDFATSMELKGLDIVRRDWCALSKDLGNLALAEILSGRAAEDVVGVIHQHLRDTREKMDKAEVPLEKFIITKQLTKDPEAYPDSKSQPHVQVAMRRKVAGKRDGVAAGETVPYVVCVKTGEDGGTEAASGKGLADRAYHPEEVTAEGSQLAVDVQYYLAQQIHPVVSRLCAPIEATDAAHIADCLGLDPSKFNAQVARESGSAREDAVLGAGALLDDDERYRACEALQLLCPACHAAFAFCGAPDLVQRAIASPALPNPFQCPKCSAAPAGVGAGAAGGAPPQDSPAATTGPAAGAPGPPKAASPATASKPDDLVTPVKTKDADHSRAILTPPMLSNQVKLRADSFVSKYYDGEVQCDEACRCTTRCLSTRVLGGGAYGPGMVSPNHPHCQGRMARTYTEADLYKQLTHFVRQLDLAAALEKVKDEECRKTATRALQAAPWLGTFEGGLAMAKQMQGRSAYKWVQLDQLLNFA